MGRLNNILATESAEKAQRVDGVNNIHVEKSQDVMRDYKEKLPKVAAWSDALSAKLEENVEPSRATVAPDLRTLTDPTRYTESVDETLDALYAATQESAFNLMDVLGQSVTCAKTGRFIYSNEHTLDDITCFYAAMENDESTLAHAFGHYAQTVAPHFINTSPEQLDKLRVVDPCGLFVWLSSQLVGNDGKSYDKRQGSAGFTEKLLMVKDRALCFDRLTRMSDEVNELSDKNELKIAVANDLMLKILALTSFRNIFRSKFDLEAAFYDIITCAQNIDDWANWCKSALYAISEGLIKGKSDLSDAGITRKAELMQGNTSMRSVVTTSLNQQKRQWINRLGISLVVHRSLLDSLTADELLMPAIQNGAWPIDKLRDPNVKARVHNAIVLKSAGKAGKLLRASDKAKTKLQKEIEVSDFLDMADIRGMV